MTALDDRIDALLGRAEAARHAGRAEEAVAHYEAVLALDPALPNSWFNLALMQRRARRFHAALVSYERALAHRIDAPEEVHLNRGVIYADDLRDPAAAERELDMALALNPQYVPALLNLGNLHEDLGRRDAAHAAYARLLAIAPGHADALARQALLAAPDADAVTRLRRAIAALGRAAADRATLGFALAQVLDALGDHDAAFAAAAAANRDSRAAVGTRFDAHAHSAFVDALIATFDGREPAVGAAPKRQPPVFICGMFRSGSTLLEQLLAGHPRITAGGELDWLPALVRGPLAPYPQSLARIDGAALRRVAEAQLDAIDTLFPGADLVTDKRPDNYFHIGLVKRLYPAARILHTVRDPFDIGVSTWFAHLAQPWSTDLGAIGQVQREYWRLMAHWKTIWGDAILDIDYDALVRDPRPVVDAALHHIGLDWDDACLAHAARGNAIRTASVWQVRQPLHARSSGRWRHYAKHLAPLAGALGKPLPGQMS